MTTATLVKYHPDGTRTFHEVPIFNDDVTIDPRDIPRWYDGILTNIIIITFLVVLGVNI